MISRRVQRMHHRRDHNQGRQDPPLDLHPHPKHNLAPGPTHAPPPRSQPGETTPSPTPAPTPQTQSHARSNARTTTEIAGYRTQVSASPFCPITGAGAGMQRRLDAQRAQEGQSVRAYAISTVGPPGAHSAQEGPACWYAMAAQRSPRVRRGGRLYAASPTQSPRVKGQKVCPESRIFTD